MRRREWAVAAPGVYVNHTGPLTWSQRAWSAVLGAHPAVLSHQSAIRAAGGPGGEAGPIHVAVAGHRKIVAPRGVVVHYSSHLDERAMWSSCPPRMRVEDAVLDVAANAPDRLRVVAHLADAVGARLTTADRLLDALRRRTRARHRRFLVAVLADIRDGTHSVLEHEYLAKVERRHGLPTARRQAPTGVGRAGYRDADCPEWGLIVELDGRLAHDSAAARDRDLERDLDAVVDLDRTTLRLGWGQVCGRPCSTAAKVARILRKRGWSGSFRRCPDCPDDPRSR
nr:hypothetical protein [Gordonia araii]